MFLFQINSCNYILIIKHLKIRNNNSYFVQYLYAIQDVYKQIFIISDFVRYIYILYVFNY